MNYRSFTSIYSLLLIALFPVFSVCAGNQSVMVKAWSDDEFRNDHNQSSAEETYVFYRGHFEPGKSKTLLGAEDLNRILLPMETALKKQNFIRVNADQEEPDLLVIVHWGETTVKINEEIEYVEENGMFNEDSNNYYRGNGEHFSVRVVEQDPRYEKINAELLGTSQRIYGRTGKIKKDLAKNATAKERYFFILEAYDFKKLLKREKVLRWKTQFSMESKWNDYETALLGMCEVASNYFGKNLDDLSTEQPTYSGKVEIGELEVIDTYNKEDLSEFKLRNLRN